MGREFFRQWMPIWVIPSVIGFAVGTVWLRLSIYRTTYEISQTDKMIRNQREELEKTELQLARMRSPGRLERLARTRFDLTPPSADRIIHLAPAPAPGKAPN